MTDATTPPVRDQPDTTIPFVVMERPAAGGETV